MSDQLPGLWIGDLADRVGVSAHVLRAWERRYGLLTPSRTAKGYRRYGPRDEQRAREMRRLRNRGVDAASAAALVLGAERTGAGPAEPRLARGHAPADHVAALQRSLESFDEVGGQAALDALFEELSVEDAISEVVMPYLAGLGRRWSEGQVSIAHEHFASNMLRRRLGALALTWGIGTGPVAMLACLPGEQHDLGLLAFGVVLGRAGWQVRFLGVDTPLADVAAAAQHVQPDLVVLACAIAGYLERAAPELAQLPLPGRLALAGAGVTSALAQQVGALHLVGDPVSAAMALSVGAGAGS